MSWAEIRVGAESSDGSYPVSMHVEGRGGRATGVFSVPFSTAEIDRAREWMEQGLVDTQPAREFGTRLFEALFTARLREVYEDTQKRGVGFRVRLVLDTPRIARLPWELLYDARRSTFLADEETTLVRGANLIEALPIPRIEAPLRLLIVDAFPRGVFKVQHQVESSGVRKALAELSHSGDIEVVTLPHATLSQLREVLTESIGRDESRPFHMLHFIGHSRYDPVSNRMLLLFEGNAGEAHEVDVATFVSVVSPFKLKLVFLNVCQSRSSSALDLASTFAPAMLQSGIPCVISMQLTVFDEPAVQFVRNFYRSLLSNQPVDRALAHAHRRRSPRPGDSGVPICYLRTSTGQIFDLQRLRSIPFTRTTWRTWFKTRAKPVVTGWQVFYYAVGVLLTVVGVYQLLVGVVLPRFEGPALMQGDLNIVVAQFGEVDATGNVQYSKDAADLSGHAYRLLDEEVDSIYNSIESSDSPTSTTYYVEVRPPNETGRINGATAEERARNAESLARRIEADVIVYGNLRRDDGWVTLVPEFYIADRLLIDAEELVGQHTWGAEIVEWGDPENMRAMESVRHRLLERTRALAQFVFGLRYYSDDHFDVAARYFEAAEAIEGWDDEVLYQFLGNTAGHLGDLDTAQWFYEQALERNPGYARAQLGIAEVLFQRSMGQSCEEPPASVEGLYQSIDLYRSALQATDQPASSAIGAKVALSVGRIYLCLSLAGVGDHWLEAERELRSAIEQYDAGSERARDLAAEAYGALGIIAAPTEGDPDSGTRFRQAADMYIHAIELSRHPSRVAHFYRMLGYMYERLNELDHADSAYARAKAADPDPTRDAYYEELRQTLRDRHSMPATSTP